MKKRIVPEKFKYYNEQGQQYLIEFANEAVERFHLYDYFRVIDNGHTRSGWRIPRDTLAIYMSGARIPKFLVVETIKVPYPGQGYFDYIRNSGMFLSEDIAGLSDEDLPITGYSSIASSTDWGDYNHYFLSDNPIPTPVIEFRGVVINKELLRRMHRDGRIKKGLDEVLLGYYYPEMNMLLVCDLTHSEHTLDVFGSMIDELKSRGLLVKITDREPVNDKKKRIVVTVGCDPEFEYLDKKGYVWGNIPSSFIMFDHSRNIEEIGIDGSGCVAEIRPEPAVTPSKLVKNIQDLFEKVKNHKLGVLGDRYAIGCHIHFGVGADYYPDGKLLGLLDEFIGKPCAIMNGDARGDYACLGSARPQPHGFEYRPLPAAVIANPEFFKIVVKVCKMIVQKYVNEKVVEYDVERMNQGIFSEISGTDIVYRRNIQMPTRESYKRVCGLKDDEITYFHKYLDWYDVEPLEKLTNVIACWVVGNEGDVVGEGLDLGSHRHRDREQDQDSDEEYESDNSESSEPRSEPQQIDHHFYYMDGHVRFTIHFCEYWNRQTYENVSVALDLAFRAEVEGLYSEGLFNNLRADENIQLDFNIIGLRESRGLAVHGFEPPVVGAGDDIIIQHYRVSCLDSVSFGVSRWFREQHENVPGEFYDYFVSLRTSLVDAICFDIVNRLRDQVSGRILHGVTLNGQSIEPPGDWNSVPYPNTADTFIEDYTPGRTWNVQSSPTFTIRTPEAPGVWVESSNPYAAQYVGNQGSSLQGQPSPQPSVFPPLSATVGRRRRPITYDINIRELFEEFQAQEQVLFGTTTNREEPNE
jgi:hypothetical protein